MEIYSISSEADYNEALKRALNVLRSGGVVVHPTDTCYGFAVDIFQKNALKRLYELKKMPLDKPVSIMVASLEQAKYYGSFSQKALELAQKGWPGALTLVVPRKDTLPRYFNKNVETIGFRIPASSLCLALVNGLKRPLTTTSANLSGLPPVYSVDDLARQFEQEELKPDFILDAGELKKNFPSRIFEVRDNDVFPIR
ncbi:threonylcarbamoyl-AMP synthase [Candidatus Peregrinibacteria bacterium]|nr:threonylcarbamoyl-AMP synthase [Candidatus Peregrinibacteria bacterium]